MSSSEDDLPLGKNRKIRRNGVKSKETISPATERHLSKSKPTNGKVSSGISIRNGPVEETNVAMTNGVSTNGTLSAKRKARPNAPNEKAGRDTQSFDDDNQPVSKRRRTSTHKQAAALDSDTSDEPLVNKSHSKKPPKISATEIGESESAAAPISEKLQKEKDQIEKLAAEEAKALRAKEKKDETGKKKRKHAKDESDDEPLIKRKSAGPKKEKHTNGVKKEESEDDVPLAKMVKSSKKPKDVPTKASAPKKAKGKALKKEETEHDEDVDEEEGEEGEEEHRWWEQQALGDGSKKWTTLEHNGVVFPPPYETLPKNVKMIYDGTPLTLEPEAEEVAGFYGAMLNSTHNVENPTFNKNFFADFKKILDKTGHGKDKDGKAVNIEKFEKCDFNPIFEYFDAQRAAKKASSSAEKKALKAAKDAAEAPYMFCKWDGRKQKVGNFRVEPPGLFRGRGEHPKTGMVKKRVQPEQVSINIGEEAKVPAPPEGHNWKDVKHDDGATWLAMWQENINGAYKYVMLAANSDVKGQSDYKKFEKARELKKHIDRIRKDYEIELKDKEMVKRQRATAVYLIDKFALRAGNEKGEDEADTVGCCSLKFEHVTMQPPDTVIFDFLGKDSIRFYNEVHVDPQVFKNLRIFKQNKEEGDEIFDRLSTSALNKHLSNYMPGLTAKVFRTYNASWTMASLLKVMKSTGTVPEKVKDYNDANRKVAILCNHKRTVAASHAGQMEKMQDRIGGLRYQQWRVKQTMLDLDPKLKKKKGAEWFELPEGLDEEWVIAHQKFLVEEQRQKIEKKFQKENEKLIADGEKEMKQKELEERLEVIDELEKKFKKENKAKKIEAEGKSPSVEKLETMLEKLDQRIETMKVQAEDKDNNKEVALGTSKINYIDPRLTVVFSKKFSVPVERFFSKSLREKFDWAIKSVDENWEF